jgi:hypothetical protein
MDGPPYTIPLAALQKLRMEPLRYLVAATRRDNNLALGDTARILSPFHTTVVTRSFEPHCKEVFLLRMDKLGADALQYSIRVVLKINFEV